MNINTELFFKTIPIMIKGMSGIFIVTGVIILIMIMLNKFTADESQNNK